MKIYVNFAFLMVLYVIVFGKKTSLKKRIETLEKRQNILEIRVNTDVLTYDEISSLQQDIDTVNGTINSLIDKVCPETTRNKERVKIKQTKVFTENAEIDSYRRFMSLGIADEKKWLRDKVQTFENNINHQKNRIDKSVSQINDKVKGFDKAIDAKFDAQTEEINKLQTKLLEMSKTFSAEVSFIRNDTNNQKHRFYRSVSTINETLKGFYEAADTKLDAHTEEINKLQTKFREMNEVMLRREQEITNMLSAISAEVSVIKKDANQMLEQEKLKSKEMIQYLQLQIRLLKENQQMFNEKMKLTNQANLVGCSDNWIEHGSFCYLHRTDSKIYSRARDVCSRLGASVADIQSKAENDFIFSLEEKGGWSLWLGFTYEMRDHVWISDRTGSSADYTNWQSTSRIHYHGVDCVQMGDHDYLSRKWLPRRCGSELNAFVCKKIKEPL